MSESRPVPPLQVFLSYSHRDEELCERFLVHLRQLQREGLIQPWHDRRITAGKEWAGAIDENLESAHIVILLVTADFLASDYCNDVELTRAIERSRSGETRVVPVICKPCEWKTSALACFQVLPKDGLPVVDWKTSDHGLDDAVKGLHRTIVELCGTAPVQVRVFQTAVRRHRWLWAGGVLAAVLLLTVGWLWSSSRDYLKQATGLLNTGNYAAARPALESAKRRNPFSRMAACGLEATELDAIRSDRVRFEQQLAEANREYPGCPYLLVLIGDEKYRMDNRRGALVYYYEAVKREPQLAEAYFDLGRILSLEGDPDAAFIQYQKAAAISPGTPKYSGNLADLYFRSGEYDKALEQYGAIGEFPLAAIEAAKILRLQNRLNEARGREEDAIKWLKDPAVKHAEQQSAWTFAVSPTREVQLRLFEEKQCYADLELSVTRFLQGDDKTEVAAVFDICSSRQQELSDILRWELRRLGSETPLLGPRAETFTERFLART